MNALYIQKYKVQYKNINTKIQRTIQKFLEIVIFQNSVVVNVLHILNESVQLLHAMLPTYHEQIL